MQVMIRRGLLLLRLQMGMMVVMVMMMVVVVRGLRRHAQVVGVLEVATSVLLSARCNDIRRNNILMSLRYSCCIATVVFSQK